MEQYKVRGSVRSNAVCRAIEASGGTVLKRGEPNVAPFELTVKLPDGDVVDLVCYAFTANKYKQKNRPKGEHRFQVKYGSDFHRSHDLFIDPTRRKITLFFGVHDRLKLFIAADPAMHNPTWFSSSVEFKQHHLEKALDSGWYGWERHRVARGRRRVTPTLSVKNPEKALRLEQKERREAETDLRNEVLLAFRPEQFLTYAGLERMATGLDPGERLLLIRSMLPQVKKARRGYVSPKEMEHLLLKQFEISASDLLDLINENLRLRTAVRGGVAEFHLERALRSTSGIVNVIRVKEDGTPDFEVTFRGRVFRIECKNVGPDLVRGLPSVDFQKTRAAKGDPCTRYYQRSQFEVLAACIHPITKSWEFRFRATKELPLRGEVSRKRKTKTSQDCPDRLSEHVFVEETWDRDLPATLQRLADV